MVLVGSHLQKNADTYAIIAHYTVGSVIPSYDNVDVISIFKGKPTIVNENDYYITKRGGCYDGYNIGTIIILNLEANETI